MEHAVWVDCRYVPEPEGPLGSPNLKVTCQYLPLTNYCNLNIYGSSITTGQDIFEPDLDSRN